MNRMIKAIVAGICILILTNSIGANHVEAASYPDIQPVKNEKNIPMSIELEKIIRKQVGNETDILTDEQLNEINDFYYDGSDLLSISGLERCRNLHNVMLLGPVESFGPVFALPELNSFVSAKCDGELDFSLLANKNTLKKFFYRGSIEGADISPLFSHKGLKRIELHGVDSDTFRMIMENLPELEMFDITSTIDADDHNQISSDDLAALAGMKIHVIKLSNCKKIKDLSALKSVDGLNCIWLYNCGVEDITPLAQIATLKDGIVDLRENPVQDFSALSGLGLYKLYVTESDAYTLEELQEMLPGTIIEMQPSSMQNN